MAIRGAIFDFGGVLTTDPLAGLQRYEENLGVPRGALLALIIGRDTDEAEGPWQRLERGELAVQEFWAGIKERAQRELGVGLTLESLAGSFRGTWGVRERIVELVRELGDEVVLVLLTNNVAELAVVWREMIPVDDLFDAVIDSSAVGIRKPDPRIFEMALEAAGVRAEETVFVDDSIVNVRAAEKLGIHGIHFTSEDEVIARVRELVGASSAGATRVPYQRRPSSSSTRSGRSV
jgi:putative hydrolase of the HAD superfamily